MGSDVTGGAFDDAVLAQIGAIRAIGAAVLRDRSELDDFTQEAVARAYARRTNWRARARDVSHRLTSAPSGAVDGRDTDEFQRYVRRVLALAPGAGHMGNGSVRVYWDKLMAAAETPATPADQPPAQ